MKTKEKQNEYARASYRRNAKDRVARVKARREQIRLYLLSVKTSSSCACGENHWATLDFHHTDKTQKAINIADMAKQGWGTQRIQQELTKCILICANCHRKLEASLRSHNSMD